MLAGELVWCLKCGCYGESRGKGLATICRGKPTDFKGGGLAGQLRYLQAGKHPTTFEDMPPSVDERGCLYKPIAIPSRAANRDQQAAIQQVKTMRELDGPRRSSIVDTPGRSSGEKLLDRLEMVRARERAANAAKAPPARQVVRRLRGKQWSTQWQLEVLGTTLQCPCPPGNPLS